MNWLKAILRAVFAMPPGGIKPGWPVVPPPIPPPVQPLPSPDAVASDLLRLHNTYRAQHGVAPLAHDARLRSAAASHAQHMARVGILAHQGIGNGDLATRMTQAGYRGMAGENIAPEARTAADALAMWMDSDGHRQNILGSQYRDFGGAVAFDAKTGRPYWCCCFGRTV